MRRFAPPLAAFTLVLACLAQPALTLPQHSDEAQYIWSGAHYGGMLAALDFSIGEPGADLADAGWHPFHFWSLTQPMGTRYFYAAALRLTGSSPPMAPFDRMNPSHQGAAELASPETLHVARGAAVLSAAVGLALIAARLGWPGFAAGALLLAIPHVRTDLALAWAEGPLLLGLGLCAATFGTRWFALAVGLAMSFKLTALGLWPLLLWRRAAQLRPFAALGLTLLIWTLLEPPSWWMGGPAYLVFMVRYRQLETAMYEVAFGKILGLPGMVFTRYLWPIELGAALAIVYVVFLLQRRLSLRFTSRGASQPENVRLVM